MRALCLLVFLCSFSYELATPPSLYKKSVYFLTGSALGTVSLLTKGIATITPDTKLGHEANLLSEILACASKQSFLQLNQKKRLCPMASWQHNREQLRQVQVRSIEDAKLVHFLEKRWLNRQNGFYPSMISWLFPAFNIELQVEPTTTSCYGRNPSDIPTKTYLNRVASWKEKLPHPKSYPLILTRPYDLKEYLPSYIELTKGEKAKAIAKKAKDGSVILDVTALGKKEWNRFRKKLSKRAASDNVICIERLSGESVGGIRILPLAKQSSKEKHLYLEEHIGRLGLAATGVELDRTNLAPKPLPVVTKTNPLSTAAFLSSIETFALSFQPMNKQKELMANATCKLLKGLVSNATIKGEAKKTLAALYFRKIESELSLILSQKKSASFYDFVNHIVEIHTSLSALLEVVTPYDNGDFSSIYKGALQTLPASLQPLTQHQLHASGMTSFCGIMRACEKSLGRLPCVLYGKNTYFESLHSLKEGALIDDAHEEQWQNVDLLISQFNPVLHRNERSLYGCEDVAKDV